MNPLEVIKWLRVCSTDCHAGECKECPYNKEPYEAGCGKLLSDAALLLSAVHGENFVTANIDTDKIVEAVIKETQGRSEL